VASPPAPTAPAPAPSAVARLAGALAVLAGTPRILGLVWSAHPPTAAVVLLLNVIQGLNPLISAWLNKLVLDAVAAAVSGPGDPAAAVSTIGPLLVLRAAYQAFSAALGAPVRYAWQQLSDHVTRRVEELVLSKSISLRGIAFFESPRFFDLLQRVQNQALARPINIVNNLTFIIRTSLTLTTMTAAFFLFSPWLTVLIVVATIPHLVSQFRNRREAFQINNWSIPEVRTMHYMTALMTHRNDVKEVRLFGLGDFLLNRFLETFEAFRDRHQALRRRHWLTTVALSALSAGAQAAGFAAVLFAAVEGRVSLGDFLFYTTALSQMQGGLNGIVQQVASLYEANLYVGTLFELQAVQETLPVPPPGTARRVAAPLRKGIELRDVGFTYPGGERAVLQDVSFTIEPGQVVALVGENGAGKSTLVKLLTRLYDPTAGRILVDGADLREHDLEDWRRHLGVVFQDFSQFALPARENIGIGSLPLIEDPVAVRAAAVRAGADTIVERLPRGYETPLGRLFRAAQTDGVDLSGGEWQRIALARAFMRTGGSSGTQEGGQEDAQLLILDEPTSAMDARAEYDLHLRFKGLTRGRSTVLISHRFSTVRMADHIVVLDGGRVAEQGSHEQLIACGGMYARLYAMQAERYAE
jgi:ATP-binding cassette subfamily B protein